MIDELTQRFPLGQEMIGEQNQKDFIGLFGAILRLKNILTAFDSFAEMRFYPTGICRIIRAYILISGMRLSRKNQKKENINDDIVFEIELIRQVEINIDYILMLVEKYHDGNCEDKEILVTIDKAINSSIQLRSKKELIDNFIRTVNVSTEVEADWRKFVLEQKETDYLSSSRRKS